MGEYYVFTSHHGIKTYLHSALDVTLYPMLVIKYYIVSIYTTGLGMTTTLLWHTLCSLIGILILIFSRGAVRSAAASNLQKCGWTVVRAPCSSRVGLTYRLGRCSVAAWGALNPTKNSDKANKWILSYLLILIKSFNQSKHVMHRTLPQGHALQILQNGVAYSSQSIYRDLVAYHVGHTTVKDVHNVIKRGFLSQHRVHEYQVGCCRMLFSLDTKSNAAICGYVVTA
jgi:hypothetical protein